ncbi:hypothetical protein [Aquabacterium sp. CECT 9606]|uniref:hypothetical protein n=1 Tax=Aquabacterium sp. CECT 9606 TaxID=2845822 RepID=UPI001E62AD15|nr:hypothetical protein [Aquabacterium sp. CECT 9606]CAH0353451.1 hypothetical protein AQB9606_03237 [Aquabacterium sp. CECT 9606]
MGVLLSFWFGLHGRKPLQDAARLDGMLASTSLAEGGQLQLEVVAIPYALIDLGDVLIYGCLYSVAFILTLVRSHQ